MEIKKILVPLDGSPESEKAFTFGLDLAEKYDARLVLAHVVDMNEKMTALDQVTMSGYVPSEILDEGYRLLSRSARKVPPHIRLDTMVRIGAPPQTLLSMAEDTGADLIVMGSRGLGAVRSIVMGSGSQYILHHARAMVTIVK